jgi:hypothetical protein
MKVSENNQYFSLDGLREAVYSLFGTLGSRPRDRPTLYIAICKIYPFTVSVKWTYVHAPTFFWQGFVVLQNEGHDFPTIDVRCIYALRSP